MIDPGPGLPPHIALLLNEEFDFSDRPAVVRKLKSMVRELKDQADYSAFQDLKPEPGEFRAVLSGGLDLFSGAGACQALRCRANYAEQVSRTVAIMADRVTAHDYFYERIHDLRSRPNNKDLSLLVTDLLILNMLKPLIEAGVLRFTSPFSPVCSSCSKKFDERVDRLAERTLAAVGSDMSIERMDGEASVFMGSNYDPPLHVYFDPDYAADRQDDDLRLEAIEQVVRSALWDARSASWISGSVFSNSQTAISALLTADGIDLDRNNFRAFAAERTAHLPWVSGLSISQTIELREAASSALPQLREFLARRLVATGGSSADESWMDTVAELREQAEQTRAELTSVTSKSRAFRRSAGGVLGLAVSAACLAVDGAASALGGLVGTISLVHPIAASQELHADLLKTRPGYVLVAADEILRHAT